MKTLSLKSIISFLLIITFSENSYSQTILINGQPSDGKLEWSDFTGEVDQNSNFIAYTAYRFKVEIDSVHFAGDSAVIKKFNVILELDKENTWAKMEKVTDALLVHEQGHFNLGILSVQEIMQKFEETKFTRANLNSQLEKLFDSISTKYNELELKYDQETDHSKNWEKQQDWNRFFQKNLFN